MKQFFSLSLQSLMFCPDVLNVSTLTSASGARISCPAASSNLGFTTDRYKSEMTLRSYGKHKPTKTLGPRSKKFSRLEGHVPPAVEESIVLERVEPAQELQFSVGLSLNNEDELQQEVAGMYNPDNVNYHRFFSSQDLQDRYLPTEAQITVATDVLTQAGMEILSYSSHLFTVKGSVGEIEKLFQTEIKRYQHPSGKIFIAPAYELQTPAGTTIEGIFGLSDFAQASHHLSKRSAGASPKFTNYVNAFYPSDIKTAYNVPSSATGAGQTIALVALDGFTTSDITDFQKCYACTSANNTVPSTAPVGSPNVNLEIHPVPTTASILSAGPDADETTLDIEMIIAMAPGLSKIKIYESAGKDFNSVFALYTQINADNSNTPIVISTSWGFPETQLASAYLKAENQLFAIMASQGQTLVAASGDSGAYDDGTRLSVDDPASQPFVLGVGGTSLYVNTDGSYHSETSWLQWFSKNPISLYGGGGGVSSVWQIPSWQIPAVSGVQGSQSYCSMRQVPDVSLNADPETGYAVRFNGMWQIFGGTSAGRLSGPDF